MSAALTSNLINNWATARYELLNTRICDLGLAIEGSPLAPSVARLHKEFRLKGLRFRPECYLTDSWGCPDEVPVIGVPFYLADRRLSRIEDEETGELESDATVMMYLRHEAGHAVNYAYRLWEAPGWTEAFGSFTRPYRDAFQPEPMSRDFVRHLAVGQMGRTYAQKHPDEDFAETFAVWLNPRSSWRTKYRDWGAMRKLRFVARLMRDCRAREPVRSTGRLLNPVSDMTLLLREHYGQRAERYRATAQGYVDDKLREIFPPLRGRGWTRADLLILKNWADLLARVTRWSGLEEDDAATILDKIQSRAHALRLRSPCERATEKLLDVTAMATALAMDVAYTGRFAR